MFRKFVAAVLVLSGVAWAEDASEPTPRVEPAPAPVITQRAPAIRNYLNLRVGASSSATRPEICIDGSPLAFLSFEACGTGSGFLHKDPDPETAHFRSNLRLYHFDFGWVQLQPRVGLGFAEIQQGEDDSGFLFTGVGPRGVETAGPEATTSLQALIPINSTFELVGNLTTGLIYAPHAPKLIKPMPTLQPFVTFTVGAGF